MGQSFTHNAPDRFGTGFLKFESVGKTGASGVVCGPRGGRSSHTIYLTPETQRELAKWLLENAGPEMPHLGKSYKVIGCGTSSCEGVTATITGFENGHYIVETNSGDRWRVWPGAINQVFNGTDYRCKPIE